MPTHSSDFFTDYRERIDTLLYQQFDEQIESAHTVHANYAALWTALGQLAKTGGKRIRPQLLLHTYKNLGGESINIALPIAVALELFHISILVHDDIIDRDDTRHGIDNIIGTYKKQYRSFLESPSDRQHFAESAGILAGDALLAKAFAILAATPLAEPTKTDVTNLFYQMVFEVAGGELLDTEAVFMPKASISSGTIIAYKTASYSFIYPMLMGARLAGADSETTHQLTQLGQELGTVFQLRDDYESIFATSEDTGKPAHGDLREGKHTRLIELFYARASSDARAQFEQSFGNPVLTTDQAQKLQSLLQQSGAVDELLAQIDEHSQQARDLLEQLSFGHTLAPLFAPIIQNTRGKQ